MNFLIDKLEKPQLCRRFVADIRKLCSIRKNENGKNPNNIPLSNNIEHNSLWTITSKEIRERN